MQGKRQAKVVELTKELEECIGDGGLQTHLDKEDIGEMLSHFLETVDKNKKNYISQAVLVLGFN